MQNQAIKSTPFLRRVAMQVSAYANDEVELSFTLPDYSQDAACGLSLYPRAALTDHEILSIAHNEYEGLTVADQGDYGIPAGQVASFLGRPAAGTDPIIPGAPVKLWPGYFKNDRLPCAQTLALWAIRGTRKFTVRLRRLYGATEITQAYMWTVPIEDRDEHRRLCDGRKNLSGRPFWWAQRLQLPAAAGVSPNPVQLRWEQYDSFALRVKQIFAGAYADDGAALDFDEGIADATLIRLRGYSDERLFPEYVDERQRLREFATLNMQAFDCNRDPGLVVPDRGGFRIYTERDVTTDAKEVRLGFYGCLADMNVT